MCESRLTPEQFKQYCPEFEYLGVDINAPDLEAEWERALEEGRKSGKVRPGVVNGKIIV
jgi:hypothetical protein